MCLFVWLCIFVLLNVYYASYPTWKLKVLCTVPGCPIFVQYRRYFGIFWFSNLLLNVFNTTRTTQASLQNPTWVGGQLCARTRCHCGCVHCSNAIPHTSIRWLVLGYIAVSRQCTCADWSLSSIIRPVVPPPYVTITSSARIPWPESVTANHCQDSNQTYKVNFMC